MSGPSVSSSWSSASSGWGRSSRTEDPETTVRVSRRRSTRRALSTARTHLQKRAVKLLGWMVFGYLVVKLLPGLGQALHSLEHVSWQWLVGALASNCSRKQATSCRGGRSSIRRTFSSVTVGEGGLARGLLRARLRRWNAPSGRLPLTSIGVGAWILRHFGMPSHTIAQRQFNLSFLNTAVNALALIVFGAGLAAGVSAGNRNLLLTLARPRLSWPVWGGAADARRAVCPQGGSGATIRSWPAGSTRSPAPFGGTERIPFHVAR